MSPARRREAVVKAMAAFEISERRACRALGVPRSTQRYIGTGRERDEALLLRVRELSREHPRYGYRRITALLRREGWSVNRKRVHRLWRREGLKVPQIRRKRRRLGHGEARTVAAVVAPSDPTTSGATTSSTTRPPTGGS